MTTINIEKIRIFFSKERLIPYGGKNKDVQAIIQKYNNNILLCEAMYPALHYFEILLRNHIDQAISNQYGYDWLLKLPSNLNLSGQDKAKIEELKLQVRREKRRTATHADIVSRLNFGFWCALFHKRYDPILWHRKNVVRSIFPNLKREHQNRKYIEHRILKIKRIRNRIAHHERIWDDNAENTCQLLAAYKDCVGLIYAMSKECVYLLNQVDRFPNVYDIITKENMNK